MKTRFGRVKSEMPLSHLSGDVLKAVGHVGLEFMGEVCTEDRTLQITNILYTSYVGLGPRAKVATRRVSPLLVKNSPLLVSH